MLKKLIKKNWFKILIALLLLGFFIIYFKNNYISSSELYKINQDCSAQALAFAKSKSNEYSLWQVNRNFFDKTKGFCFAEFWIMGLKGVSKDSHEIYNLTHNENLAFIPVNQEWVSEASLSMYQDNYDKISDEIFGKQK